jgi:O-antigen ligase
MTLVASEKAKAAIFVASVSEAELTRPPRLPDATLLKSLEQRAEANFDRAARSQPEEMTELSGARVSVFTRAAELIATYGIAAWVLCLPLEFTTRIFRQPISRYVLLLVAASYIYLMLARRRSIGMPRRLSVWLLLVFLVASLASWASTRAQYSVNSLLDVALYPFVALMIANLPLSETDHRRAWLAFIASGLGVATIGFVLYVTGLHIWSPNPLVANRLNITFADPNITARFLTVAMCAAVLMFSARKAPGWLTVGAAVACAVVLPMTWSRSGLALFVIGAAVAVILAFNRKRAVAIAAIAMVAFAGSALINPDTRDRAGGAVSTVVTAVTGGQVDQASAIPGNEDVSLADNRVYLVRAGWSMFVEHPLTGVGFGGFQHAMLTDYKSFLPKGYTDSVSHTALITVLAEQGLLGVLLFLAFLVALAWEALAARRRPDRWAFWSTLAATLVIPIFLYSQFEARFLQEPYLWLALGLYYSTRMLARRQAVAEPEAERSRASAAAAA